MGGAAMALHGLPRMTKDIDLLGEPHQAMCVPTHQFAKAAMPVMARVTVEICACTTARSYLKEVSLKYVMLMLHFQDMLPGKYF